MSLHGSGLGDVARGMSFEVQSAKDARDGPGCEQVLYPLKARVHTIAWNNGSRFAAHPLIDTALETKSYFADPYSTGQGVATKTSTG